MSDEEIEKGLTLDKKTIEVLVAQVIPTSKYFEVRFDHMQDQINGLRYDLKEFKGDVGKRFDSMNADMNQRFERVDQRFDSMKADMDQRFERVDQRFDSMKADMDQRFAQADKRSEQIIASIDRLTDKLDHRDEKQRSFTLRMFTISISISVAGVLGVFLKIFGVF
ncbi:hypothetical protein BuS5_01992 [Desulfosarcina sp. BuS5]|uniref:hypothetical protein n=1 Tax=Desulfosarcina sp. BuS5 TaxID=933262 RepID=UPI000687953B|nr:hypothetical protein [Desulfosarcina sp. BuS5]WDN89024.1 hypothetical protein BuS5_01992 [Desulfosarcina sp. BuS5]